MKKGKNNSSIFMIGIVVVIGATAGFIYSNRKNKANVSPGEPNQETPPSAMAKETSLSPNTDTPVDRETRTSSPQTDTNLADKVKDTVRDLTTPRPRLQDIVSAAGTWMPSDIHQDWIGKPAPDFTVQDINGKQHSLNDYRGKNVIIALWAPSFAPSLPELTKLAKLQDDMGQEQLVVLGLSFAAEGAIRRYVESQPSISYPIVAGANQDIPAPYSQGKPLPGAMFVSPDGKLKLSTRGTLPPEDAKSILEAR
jgi:peroxiredoxin